MREEKNFMSQNQYVHLHQAGNVLLQLFHSHSQQPRVYIKIDNINIGQSWIVRRGQPIAADYY